MTQLTEIVRQHKDSEIHLTVGRTTPDGKIYIDIRHYFKGDLIDAGDIVITNTEFNLINTNLEIRKPTPKPTPKLFICPECGDVVTEEDILKDLTSGGFGCCLCSYGNGSRILVRYEPYTQAKLDPPITPSEIELIRDIRELFGVN